MINYKWLKQWKRHLVTGTYQDWINQVIDEKEVTEELLPEPLARTATGPNDRS
jgi:hypothetical protein